MVALCVNLSAKAARFAYKGGTAVCARSIFLCTRKRRHNHVHVVCTYHTYIRFTKITCGTSRMRRLRSRHAPPWGGRDGRRCPRWLALSRLRSRPPPPTYDTYKCVYSVVSVVVAVVPSSFARVAARISRQRQRQRVAKLWCDAYIQNSKREREENCSGSKDCCCCTDEEVSKRTAKKCLPFGRAGSFINGRG